MPDPLPVLFLSSEATPFSKTGGLADVAGSLPGALKQLGVDVRMVLPLYRETLDKGFSIQHRVDVTVPLGVARLSASVMEARLDDDIPVYLIEREDLYDRPHLYGTSADDYYDNLERFTFFARSALELSKSVEFIPRIVHCHDWQTGLVPALLKGPFRKVSKLAEAKSLFTIHNVGYHGRFPAERFYATGLPESEHLHMEGMEYWGDISLLKSGIVYADALTTVSPTYAREIQTAEYGMGMEGVLNQRRESLHGILNGVDYTLWNPGRDPHIAENYSPDRLSGKAVCKRALLQEMDLDPSLQNKPLLGMVSRLDTQKGLDLLISILGDLLGQDLGLVLLGSGDKNIQKALQDAAAAFPDRMGLKISFDEALSHRIIAGSDLFLIPSRYEPCGLTQMYALKYGTVPLVRATGGLDDTVTHFNPAEGAGNGFKFHRYHASAFFTSIQAALTVFHRPEQWATLVRNGMKCDFSWERSARKYLNLYQTLLRTAQGSGDGVASTRRTAG